MCVFKLVLILLEYPQMEQANIPEELIIVELIMSSRLANPASPRKQWYNHKKLSFLYLLIFNSIFEIYKVLRFMFSHVHSKSTFARTNIVTQTTGTLFLRAINMISFNVSFQSRSDSRVSVVSLLVSHTIS